MNPFLILGGSILIGLLLMLILLLIVPWLDFIVTTLNINPFRWIGQYFRWCEAKQRELERKEF